MTSGRPLRHEGGVYRELCDHALGAAPALPAVDLAGVPAPLVDEARGAWRERFGSELRSVQILTRFLDEVVGAGDPFEVWGAALDSVRDELRHVALCAAACRALGTEPLLPQPPELREAASFLSRPMPERALSTALTMLAVNETVSVGFIGDLRARCRTPALRTVLDETLADEDGHRDFGWTYVRDSMKRFPKTALPAWRTLVRHALAPHRERAAAILARVPEEKRRLDAWPDEERAPLALFSPERQALVFEQTLREVLEPRLRALDLLDAGA